MIDDQVHFREPGMPNKGKFSKESAAAIVGVITSVMDMPNTTPQTITQKPLKKNMILLKARLSVMTVFIWVQPMTILMT